MYLIWIHFPTVDQLSIDLTRLQVISIVKLDFLSPPTWGWGDKRTRVRMCTDAEWFVLTAVPLLIMPPWFIIQRNWRMVWRARLVGRRTLCKLGSRNWREKSNVNANTVAPSGERFTAPFQLLRISHKENNTYDVRKIARILSSQFWSRMEISWFVFFIWL